MSTTIEIRRFGYYIPKPDGTFDFVVHNQSASTDVLTEFHETCAVLFTLQPILISFDTVERNYRELIESIEDQRSELRECMPASMTPVSTVLDGFVLTSQKISNFLSSTSGFLAQTETQLRQVYGADSLELSGWNEKRQNLHSHSFAYQFLYELRNFSQHCSLPFSRFNIAGELASDKASMLFKIHAMILRDGLFGVGFNWKRSVEVEIRKQPAEFELLSLIPEYFHILCRLCLETVQLHSAQLAECARYFDAIRRTLKIPMGAIPVIFIGEAASKGVPPPRYESIPIEQFSYVLREYDKLLKAVDLGC